MPKNKRIDIDHVKHDALAILENLVAVYPGLLDGETEVNGADLVDALTSAINSGYSSDLTEYLKG